MTMNVHKTGERCQAMRVAAMIGMVILSASAGVLSAQMPGGGPGGDMQPPEEMQLAGTVQAFNYSPHGAVDSLMLLTSDHKTVQLDFPPEAAEKLTAAVKVGDTIAAEAAPERHGAAPQHARGSAHTHTQNAAASPAQPKSDHEVYRLSSLTTAGGKALDLRPERATVAIDGEIKRLNYAMDGTVNGFVLGDGKVVLLPPQADEAVSLAVGQKITGQASERPVAAGGVHILEAVTLNGKQLRGDAPPPPPQDGNGPPDMGGPPPAN